LTVILTIFRADIFNWIAIPQLFIFAAVAQQRKDDVTNDYLQSNTQSSTVINSDTITFLSSLVVVDAGYCYRCYVCLSVGDTGEPSKMAELIDMLLRGKLA